MKKIWKTLSILGTATVCTTGISIVAVSVSNTNNSHTSSINTLTPTDRIINIQAMSAPTGGNQISSLNFGQTAYLVAQCSDDSAILGNFTWVIESGDSNATPTYVQELTNTTISGSTCTTELSYTKAGVPANGSPIDIVVACTLNGATKRVQVTINPVAITTQLEFTSSNILDLDDADSTVTAKLTCPAVITGVTPDVNWKMDDKANPPLSIAQVGTSWGADGTAEFTITKGSQVDTGHFTITCTLTIGGVADTSTPADLNIVNPYTFTPVPVTRTYFLLNDAGDTVSGFSSAVKANYAVGGAKNMLAKFDTIDFQHSPVKYMAATASFGKASASADGNVFDAWNIRQLNLSGIKFHFDNSAGRSGNTTFQFCNFTSLKELNLFDTDFASCAATDLTSYTGNVFTASYTFSGATFNALDTLNLAGAVFAVGDMTTSGHDVYTASYTFNGATFTLLDTLSLAGAVFAVGDMTSGTVFTARNTFNGATFTELDALNLAGAVFAVGDMTSGIVHTANNTFTNVKFLNLNTLSLAGAVFAVAGMTTGAVYTASYTFSAATFNVLGTLSLVGATFAVSGMTSGIVNTAYYTFNSATFTELDALNLAGAVFASAEMTTQSVNTANYTFANVKFLDLNTLSLAGAVFAVGGTNASDRMTIGAVYTASYTFSAATFNVLDTLSLVGATFAVTGMTTGAVYTASFTFNNITFTLLDTLSLVGATFAVSGMTSGIVNTASNTFRSIKFMNLTTLTLGDIQLGNDRTGINTINGNCFIYITPNTAWSTVPLQITGTWAQTNWETQFNAWFDDDAWTYNA